MSSAGHGPPRRLPESAIVEAARRHLEGTGFRVWVDPDGHDYFDLVARRGLEVGLVEAKVAAPAAVLRQALRRRVWGDWTAVVLASERSARRLDERTRTERSAPVGVWCSDGREVRIVRPARPWVAPGVEDPYAPLRQRFRRVLDALESGELPPGVPWDGVLGEIRRASGGRGFSEWRLDEESP
jgi:hypothetical protein